ncbi:phosphoglycolate phosphatase [Rhodococcus triatomae]|uniref:Phosphoglycolate phosphatase n=1 Tax=Rhodococcus triatomae TaxID=300028 RepID=A0A1G8DBH2_9NOCA|nr:HAD-IA family hydrolase [Rhodococcus triatomae]SDH55047.1 phosphoglycolate phosphatase [Rhodococcus triatomae]
MPVPSPDSPILLFDLDGTLTDSAPGIHAGFRHALAAVGLPAPTQTQLDTVIGPPMMDTIRSLGLDEATARRALDAYLDRYDSIGWAENSVFDGIPAVLDTARDRGYRMAVATSKSERFAVRILEHFELADRFEFIGGASDDGSRRAKKDVIAHSLTALGVPATAASGRGVTMIGDRDHDILGAAHWGLASVFAGWGYGHPAESAGADHVLDSVDQLREVLDAA